MNQGTTITSKIAIIGTGFSGLCAAIRLKQSGEQDFVILEREGDVGGCWRDNSYPGCACDVESHLYSFSFAPNPDWTRMFAPQGEIHAYLRKCAREYGVMPHIRFRHGVTSARWNSDSQRWHLETERGSVIAQFVIAAPGPLFDPMIPDIEGLADFEGTTFHSARWRHDYDLRGKKVAVIGTGASSVQFVPRVQPQVQSLKVFQRTAAWVLPRSDRAITPRERALFRAVPAAQKAVREAIYLRRELVLNAFLHPTLMKPIQKLALRYLKREIHDPALRKKLTPNFTMGCKRILITSEYLPALNEPNVDVITDGITRVDRNAIITRDGTRHEVDAIIFGTGFHVTDPPYAKVIFDGQGRSLKSHFSQGPKAHLGTMVSGFPNLFVMLGPNLGLGHTSMTLVIEQQVALILDALKHVNRFGLASIMPRAQAQARWIASVDRDAEGTVWTTGGCHSWYQDETGRNASLWASSIRALRERVAFDARDYHFGEATRQPRPSSTTLSPETSP